MKLLFVVALYPVFLLGQNAASGTAMGSPSGTGAANLHLTNIVDTAITQPLITAPDLSSLWVANGGIITGASGTNRLVVQNSSLDASGMSAPGVTQFVGTIVNSTSPDPNGYWGLYAETLIPTTSTVNYTGSDYLALYGEFDHFGTGNVSNGVGVDAESYVEAGGTATSLVGLEAFSGNYGTGLVTEADAVYAAVNGPGPITTGIGVHIDAPVAGGAPVNLVGLQIENQTSGTGTNFAIKTGLGKVQFGDALAVTGAFTVGAGAPLPPCADAGGSHLNWTSTGGFACGITVGSNPKGTLSWDFGALNDGSCNSKTLPLGGASLGDPITPGFPAIAFAGAMTMFVSAIDTVQVTVCNFSGSTSADPGILAFIAEDTK